MADRLRRRQLDDGFTLVELLVVIIIIGILAAIAIPVYLNQRKRGYEASEKSDLRTTANEIEAYFSSTPDYTNIPFGNGTGVGNAITGTGVNVGGDLMSLSRGNTVTLVAAGVNGYCLSATNQNIGTTVTKWYYDSLAGGITTTVCPHSGETF